MANVSQIERQGHILSMLTESRKGLTINEIVNRLHHIGVDISRKTVERDIDYISQNFFVYEEKSDGKTVYLAKNYTTHNLTFSIAELLSLYFAREVLNSYQTLEVGKTAVRILEHIVASMPQINKNYLRSLNEMLKINVTGINPEDDLNPEYLELLKQAISETRCVKMEYYAFNNDRTTKRCFEPYIMEIYEGCWHVIGKCRLRNNIRDFRVARIRSLELMDETFTKPESFYETYRKNRFEKLSGEDKVHFKLLFTGQAARMVEEYEYSKADYLCWDGKGLLFERNAALTPEIIKWILGFGAEAEVLEPAILRNKISEEIDKMKDVYR